MRWLLVVCAACHSTSSTHVGPPSTAEVVAACEIDEACVLGASGANSADDCLRYWTRGRPLIRDEWIHCFAAAGGDCVAARACMGQTLTTNASCVPGCNGDTATQCPGFDLQLATDCTAFDPNMHCMTDGTNSECAVGPATADRCDGTYAVGSYHGFDVENDCAQIGDTCVITASGNAECGGTGPACTATRTDGNAIVYCDYGFEHRVDCALAVAGGSVQHGTTTMGGTSDYCGTGAACQPGMFTTTCTGTTLTVCAFGSTYSVDCTTLGYLGCDPNGYSRCQPSRLD